MSASFQQTCALYMKEKLINVPLESPYMAEITLSAIIINLAFLYFLSH